MNRKKLLALLAAGSLLLTATGCVSSKAPDTPQSSDDGAQTTDAPDNNASALDGTVTFGITAPLSGTNKMNGDYIMNAANLAKDKINAEGGILGKELVLVAEDEVDNMQASVNAMTKLVNNPDVVAFFGSSSSANDIGVSPIVAEKKVPMFAAGSSANIPAENNEYMWQVRTTDDKSGARIAQAAAQKLGMKNPAIMYSTESFGSGLKDQVVNGLKELGIEVPESNLYGYTTDDKNFAPIITQIQNSGVDGLIGISMSQLQAAMICQQVDAAGLDLPMIGGNSFCTAVCRDNAGDAANGWYAISDWTSEVSTPNGKAFEDAYRAAYSAPSDYISATCYDAVLLFKEACEIAGTTTDRDAINNALKEVKDFEGVMTTYNYHETRCLASNQMLVQNQNGLAVMIEVIE
ncbi:ABC transporter substrate-binding protein [Agathobaculum sp.]|uniref:ABC transporter substrate-binding protein n=1 Tax=Agathobaculum sp. TaxID=2048138 RepID=UPI002A81DC22|nr:ABC transporter substrate-binding protein [Agathobaculum sp.]MDY3617608.1 ABC transporter substrate-binding protein [Agathobaculum sp.]